MISLLLLHFVGKNYMLNWNRFEELFRLFLCKKVWGLIGIVCLSFRYPMFDSGCYS